MTPEQSVTLFGALIALIGAVTFLIRTVSNIWVNKSKIESLNAQIESDRDQVDNRTRDLVNKMLEQSNLEIQKLRGEVLALQLDNARYVERESVSNQRMTEMQGRIDILIGNVAELRVQLTSEQTMSRQQKAEYELRLSEKDAELTRVNALYQACVASKEAVPG